MDTSRQGYLQQLQRYFNRTIASISDVLDAPVSTCGAWNGYDLVEHLRLVYTRTLTRIGSTTAPPPLQFFPTQRAQALGLLVKSYADLREQLEILPAEAPAWNWTGSNLNVSWVLRRMAHETAVHSLDATLASKPASLVDFDAYFDRNFASDGIAEFMEIFLVRPEARHGNQLENKTLYLQAIDQQATDWTIALTADTATATATANLTHADTSLRGTASAIYGWLWNRVPSKHLLITGDYGVVERWKTEISM